MTLRPDYGIYLEKMGATRETRFEFVDYRMFNVTVLGDGLFSSMNNLPIDGEIYAMSLDFGIEQYGEIIKHADMRTIDFLEKDFLQNGFTPRDIALPVPIDFGVVARLRQKQKGTGEEFIPLEIVEIMAR